MGEHEWGSLCEDGAVNEKGVLYDVCMDVYGVCIIVHGGEGKGEGLPPQPSPKKKGPQRRERRGGLRRFQK